MKRITQIIILLAVLLPVTVSAYDFGVNGIYYNITSSTNMTAAVTYYSKTDNTYSGTITIPEKVTHDGKTYYVTAIGESAFVGCTGLKKVNFSSQRITSIGNYAFQGCNGITSFVIPPQITSIGTGAFNGCTGMTGVTIEESEETLYLGKYDSNIYYKGLFYDCPLISVFIGRPLSYSTSKYDGYSPFANNKTIVKARLGKKLSSIPNYLFYGCSYLNEVMSCAATPPSANANCFANYDATLYVPKGSVSAYKNATVWKDFYSIIGIDIVDDVIPGDVNGDGKVNITDVTDLIDYLLSGDASAINLAGADCNQDGSVNISDVTALIDYLLSGHWN